MWFFSRKERVRVDAFCRDFYDTHIMKPILRGVDLGATYCETVKRSIAEVDPRFAPVDPQAFASEIRLIRFEVFGLAWLHQLGDKYAAAQSAFTKSYLEDTGNQDLWHALESYNQAIARSSTAGYSSETAPGRACLAFRNEMLFGLFKKWNAQGFDPTAVARAAGRLFTGTPWKKGITPAFLMLTLCARLGCEVNEDAQTRLVGIIRGLYDGARQAMKRIRVVA